MCFYTENTSINNFHGNGHTDFCSVAITDAKLNQEENINFGPLHE